jgi:formylglycine-generating enzyme
VRSLSSFPAVALLISVNAFTSGANEMASLPAGSYAPFQRVKAAAAASPAMSKPGEIAAFRLEVAPVTNMEFLAFVTEHSEWRRSRVKPIFADARYLARWADDLHLVDAEAADEPVTNISWFAAHAYCRARGQRLPTTEEWEYALADGGRGQDEVRRISLGWFARPNASRPDAVGTGAPNGYGLKDMVGLVWEWTHDFDAFAVSAESRDPNGKNSAAFCGAAAAGVSDPSDYPAFMRYSMRASLKANYTSDNVGFRCAGDP